MLLELTAMRRIVSSLLFGVLGLVGFVAHAVSVNDLYEVTLPIQGNRESAFAEALKVVAVRVSGRRDAASRLASGANNARQYVQRFSFTADNQLQVAFDSNSVDRLLSDSGLPVWGRERPATLVLLNAPQADGAPLWIEASYPAGEREQMGQFAKVRGVPLVWPTLDSQDRSRIGSAASAPSELMAIAARHNANAVLLGQGRRDTGGNLTVHWTLTSDDGEGEVTGTLEDGVHLLADTFGRVYAAAAGALGSVVVEVLGIQNLDDYATTMNYLEGMTVVRSVAVEQVSGETMRFLLAVRGDAASLRRALALDNKLVPTGVESEAASPRLQLRLQR